MFKYVVHILTGICILMISTFMAWYEGSVITNVTWEWEHSTPFTNIFNSEITNGQDINQLDYLVYAAKFSPFFPTLMLMSVLYIVSVFVLYLTKNRSGWTSIIIGLAGFSLIIMSGFISNASTFGGAIFFWICSISGIIFIAVTGWITLKLIRFSMESQK